MGHVQRDADGFVIGLEVPEDEFCVYGTIHAHPEHADALEAVYAQTNQLAKSEPGTLQYCISRDPDDPTLFHMFEQYAGRAAFEQPQCTADHSETYSGSAIQRRESGGCEAHPSSGFGCKVENGSISPKSGSEGENGSDGDRDAERVLIASC
ncbi:hypothetical protein D0864_08373 [Hortaea werneckii]|uniref:ABM domain-containing protein n=1 Tax=Hortaea werneckii TaxID=91943 RepID=A0A3M7EXM5_HORWE|nr:hypothetical protein KC322_g2461 [Hortaea werneckii]RMY81207.1 hypothetical protein D0864_08373 [Hortaea werneckii]